MTPLMFTMYGLLYEKTGIWSIVLNIDCKVVTDKETELWVHIQHAVVTDCYIFTDLRDAEVETV